MRPILFWIGDLPIGAWPVFVAFAFLTAYLSFRLACHLAPSETPLFRGSWSLERFSIFVYLSGLLGSRVLGAFSAEDSHALLGEAHAFLGGPMTFYGGLFAGFLAACVWLWLQKAPLAEVLDRAVPAVLVGLGVGRLGCLLNGDDYGRVVGSEGTGASFVWSHLTLLGSGPGETTLRYATQLQESLASLALAALVVFALRLRTLGVSGFQWLRAGQVGLVGASLSFVNRYWNEFYRGDERPAFWNTELSQAQGMALVGFFLCSCFFLLLMRRAVHRASREESK